jgi:hypothetical protein
VIILIELLLGLFTTFMMIITIPILYSKYDSVVVDIWYKLDSLTRDGKRKLKNYSLLVIKNIYEQNNKLSIKKIIIISFLLNSFYAVIMYKSIPLPSFITKELFFTGLFSFLIGGSLVMSIFEYHAYKINIKTLKKYSLLNDKKILFYGISELIFKIYLFPFFIIIIFMLIDKTILGFIGTYILYFSPLGVLLFMLDIFNVSGGNDRFFLILSSISIHAPLIFFFFINKFYMVTKKIILPSIEFVDYLSKYIQGNKSYEEKVSYIVWGLILLLLILPILKLVILS